MQIIVKKELAITYCNLATKLIETINTEFNLGIPAVNISTEQLMASIAEINQAETNTIISIIELDEETIQINIDDEYAADILKLYGDCLDKTADFIAENKSLVMEFYVQIKDILLPVKEGARPLIEKAGVLIDEYTELVSTFIKKWML